MKIAAQTAKAIKAEITKQYPAVKVLATSQNYSGGDSVHVTVISAQEESKAPIRAICEKYQYGHFNGMEDIYECSNSQEGIPQAKYVFCRFEVA